MPSSPPPKKHFLGTLSILVEECWFIQFVCLSVLSLASIQIALKRIECDWERGEGVVWFGIENEGVKNTISRQSIRKDRPPWNKTIVERLLFVVVPQFFKDRTLY